MGGPEVSRKENEEFMTSVAHGVVLLSADAVQLSNYG
jgi:hypothetical protein